jgi:hypothetical protein
MHVRRRHYLALLLPMLLCVAALAAAAGVAAPPAAAGGATGYVTDQYDNPLAGILVEALDAQSGVKAAETTTETTGAYSLTVDSTPSGSYKVRVSDPAGIFTTTYLWGKESFDDAYVFGCT